LAGKCRNRTYQPPCEGLSDFEDRANHQIRTLPSADAFAKAIQILDESTSRALGGGDPLLDRHCAFRYA